MSSHSEVSVLEGYEGPVLAFLVPSDYTITNRTITDYTITNHMIKSHGIITHFNHTIKSYVNQFSSYILRSTVTMCPTSLT